MHNMDKKGLVKQFESIFPFEIIEAFKQIKRENFVPKQLKKEAYKDIPLPIGHKATISQPYTVLFMLANLEIKKDMKILEIGTGSGYNAALLSKIVGPKGKVYSLEISKELVKFAKNNLKKANITNVRVIHSDGSIGYSKVSPYDRIIVTAASPSIAEELILQLKPEGIILIPIGKYQQEMIKVKKLADGSITKESLGEFVFVQLRGKKGF